MILSVNPFDVRGPAIKSQVDFLFYMTNDYLLSLAREYLEVIDNIEHGRFANGLDLYSMESDRSVLHAQLEAETHSRIKKSNMPAYCRKLLRGEA